MGILHDYRCPGCDKVEEILVSNGDVPTCSECGVPLKIEWIASPKVLTAIIPAYKGSKKHAAGYVHSHADKPATKIQSGYGGAQSPK